MLRELAQQDYNIRAWRANSPRARNADFSILDRQGGAGWDLVTKLVRKRDGLNRGRLSAKGALRHPYFLLPDL